MSDYKTGEITAHGGAIIKIGQTVRPPKSWYEIIKALDEMPAEQIGEFVSFLVQRERDRAGNLDFTGISQSNGAIKALRHYDSELRKVGRKKGGATTAKQSKRSTDEKAWRVQEAWAKLDVPDHNKSTILASRFGCSRRTIDNHMKRKLFKQD